MKPIRILVFAPMPPTISGGIEEYAYSVIAHMQQQNGLDVRVVTSRFKNNNSRYPPITDNRYLFIPSTILFKRPLPITLLSFFKVAKAIAQSDIIHIHMPYPFLESFAAFISRLFDKKTIVTYHMDAKIDTDDNDEDDSASRTMNVKKNKTMMNNTNKRRFVYSLVENIYGWLSAKWPLVLSDIICTNTKAYADNSPFLKKYMHKVLVVHQGIRKELYDYADQFEAQNIRSKYLDQGYSSIVTFVGRLVPYKGLPYLIDAIDLLNKLDTENKKVLFLIGGSGPQKQYLSDLVEARHLDNIVFTGYVKDQDLFNLFAASDIVVSPSISELESTPISLVSALAVGSSVIGTSIGGTAETIPNDGVQGSIIPIKNSKILAETIDTILGKIKQREEKKVEKVDNNGKKNQSKNNKNLPTPRFWSDVAKDYIQLIYRLLDIQGDKYGTNDTHPKDKSYSLKRERVVDL
jgi:glycosyltransferase involved in cell wall biosynthesis